MLTTAQIPGFEGAAATQPPGHDPCAASNADYYGEKAREISARGSRSRSVEVRLELFEIAEPFDRMADRVESLSGPPRTRGSP
jgi:hypothetical protein